MTTQPGIVVHGGAAPWELDYCDAAREGCRAATEAGVAVLAAGGSAVDAVVAAVRVLEDRPVFNAGTGAVLNADGGFELDASIMAGDGLRFGGVAAMPNIDRPIAVARALMDAGPHGLLCGEGAWAFARQHGFLPCDPERLRTERATRRLARYQARQARDPDARPDPGTVGAVAVDASGHVAAATSTGGMTGKSVGRIGDTPLPGCGTYADDRGGAASATGEGEAIMRVAMTKALVAAMRGGAVPGDAARAVVQALADDAGGTGGVICCDASGRLAAAHNTPEMPYGAGMVRAGEVRVIDGVRLPPETCDLMSLF